MTMENELNVGELLGVISEVESLGMSDEPAALALAVKTRLSRHAAPLLNMAIEVALARRRAATYGEWTARGLFTRRSIEQATSPRLARHHASRFKGSARLLEICAGVGFDTAALAKVASHVVALERDPTLTAFLRHNLAVQGIENVTCIAGSFEACARTVGCFDAVWADPSRRDQTGKRINDPAEYQPALPAILTYVTTERSGIKISPGFTFPGPLDGWCREWIGVQGECREQVLWHGVDLPDNTVSLMEGGESWHAAGDLQPAELRACDAGYLIEPHAALIRSGGLATFFAENSFALLDPHIAYGASISPPPRSPWYVAYKVLEWLPYSIPRLKEAILRHGWDARTQFKKRGFPDDPESLRPKVGLVPIAPHSTYGVVVITRIGSDHIAFLCEPPGAIPT